MQFSLLISLARCNNLSSSRKNRYTSRSIHEVGIERASRLKRQDLRNILLKRVSARCTIVEGFNVHSCRQSEKLFTEAKRKRARNLTPLRGPGRQGSASWSRDSEEKGREREREREIEEIGSSWLYRITEARRTAWFEGWRTPEGP